MTDRRAESLYHLVIEMDGLSELLEVVQEELKVGEWPAREYGKPYNFISLLVDLLAM